jgi:transcriptional antiterminator RfaH
MVSMRPKIAGDDNKRANLTALKVEETGIDLAGSRAWVVINTLPHKEALALENLGRQGFSTYCPMIQKRVKHARYDSEVRRPLFPSYLFVHVDRDVQRWRPILSTVGVRTVVRCGHRLSFLEDGFVDALKSREIDGRILRSANYKLGQQVQIEGGAFDGLVATIVEMNEKDRLILLMDMLNRRVKVKVEANSVIAV